MAQAVVMGAMLTCTFGAAPSSLVIIPKGTPITVGGPLAANIMDHVPLVNIMPFGVCSSPAFPPTAAATAAAMGVLTPMPCIPATASPWVPGAPTVLFNNMPVLNNTSKCMCSWGGVISITNPGQVTTQVP
jgi:hypothetical protein